MKLHITANKLAALITAKTPERRRALVRSLKRTAGEDFPLFYSALRGPAKRFVLNGSVDPAELHQLIQRMSTRSGSTWINTDSRITSEAAGALIKCAPKLRALNATFVLPDPGTKAVLEYPQVDVITTPNLIVHGKRHHAPLIGAMRFYVAKESSYELGSRGAQLVAAMQHLWLLKVTSGQRIPDASLCLVLECFQQRVTCAPDASATEGLIRRGCEDFVRIWHELDDKEAA